MPTTRRRRRTQRRAGLAFSRGKAGHLKYGCDYFGDGYTGKPALVNSEGPNAEQIAEMKDDWKVYRPQIIADYIAKWPGCRPWAWWRFDWTEQGPERFTTDHERATAAMRGEPIEPGETEAEYLIRHNVLSADERQRSERAADEAWRARDIYDRQAKERQVRKSANSIVVTLLQQEEGKSRDLAGKAASVSGTYVGDRTSGKARSGNFTGTAR